MICYKKIIITHFFGFHCESFDELRFCPSSDSYSTLQSTYLAEGGRCRLRLIYKANRLSSTR